MPSDSSSHHACTPSLSPALTAETAHDPCGRCAARPLSVCRGVGDEHLAELAATIQTVKLPPRGTLASEGDAAHHYFNITQGSVKIYKLLPDGRQQIVGFLFAGDFVGLAVRDTYAYSVEAITPITACRFERKKLDGLLSRFPDMEQLLRGAAFDELAVAQEQMLSLGRKNATERVAGFLLQLSRRASRLGQPANPVHLPMSRLDIADYLGLTIETVSRVITRLKTARTIRLNAPGEIDLIDLDRLKELGEGWGEPI